MTAVKTAHKRRKIIASPRPSTSAEKTTIIQAKPSSPRSACISCHRSLSLLSGSAIQCSRCSSWSCPVCSRTCNSAWTVDQPLSYLNPPNPPSSPSRSVLALNSANTNQCKSPGLDGTLSNSKRKKAREEDDDEEMRRLGTRIGSDDESSGCGQLVCRRCCYENFESGAITCSECHSPDSIG